MNESKQARKNWGDLRKEGNLKKRKKKGKKGRIGQDLGRKDGRKK